VCKREGEALSSIRYIAPAGAPISLGDLARWASLAVASTDPQVALADLVRAKFGLQHAAFTSTGRAGMTILLQALRRLAGPARNEVVMPSYTCYSVAASAVKAGLKVRLVDISPDTLDIDLESLARHDFSRVLAVVATNLYGLPSDLPGLAAFARRAGVFLIDDAAQAMGATVGGRACGSWGDAGLFSFDKGKNVSAIDGGIVVTASNEIAAAIRDEVASLPSPPVSTSMMHVAKALAYFTMLRPSLYGIPARIPQLGLGKTVFTTEFPLHRGDPRLIALGLVMMKRLDEFTRARVSRAAALLAGLRAVPTVRTIAARHGSSPAYLRLPVLLPDARARQAAIEALTAEGLGASGSYPAALVDVPELQPHLVNPTAPMAGGRAVASRIVTLPTHPFVSDSDITRMIATLRKGITTACAA
jgi:perosamine synthetase